MTRPVVYSAPTGAYYAERAAWQDARARLARGEVVEVGGHTLYPPAHPVRVARRRRIYHEAFYGLVREARAVSPELWLFMYPAQALVWVWVGPLPRPCP